ncbi:hypothetical protein HK104_010700 [Borealophlyctis nickersoniae]|nr:hypothetical protein HK104_010700 [Borealophlyctis nickersoniae]
MLRLNHVDQCTLILQQQSNLNSRTELAKQLGIIRLIRQNKASEQPEKTFIEVITNYLVTRDQSKLKEESTLAPSRPASAVSPDRPKSGRVRSADLEGHNAEHPISLPSRPATAASVPRTARPLSAAVESHLNRFDTSTSAPLAATEPGATDNFGWHNPLRGGDHSKIGNSNDNPEQAAVAAFATTLGMFDASNPRAFVGGTLAGEGGKRDGSASAAAVLRSSLRQQSIAIGVPSPALDTHSKHNKRSTFAETSSTSAVSRSTTDGKSGIWSAAAAESPVAHRTIPSSTSQPRRPSVAFQTSDIEITDHIDDMDDFDHPPQPIHASLGVGKSGKLITTQTALALRCLVFPGEKGRATFGEEWRGKGFVFCDRPEIGYGIVQIKGGPCGLLAAVQGFILKHLLFTNKGFAARGGKVRPTPSQCRTALIDSLTEILWQAGGTRERRAIVALYLPNARVSTNAMSKERYLPDGITENMELHEFADQASTREFISSNLSQFTSNDPNRHGIIQFLYSLILTRGIETIKNEDMDEPDVRLIGRHGYCTQEMVNLIITGQATSNVFDGDVRLDAGCDSEDANGAGGKLLKGIKRPVQFGYLTLFEHYGSLKVGEYFKNPMYPIFIICSESHYTVLFSTDPALLNKTSPHPRSGTPPLRSFDLYYYDGLANQDAEIRLSITLPSRGGRRDEDSSGSDDEDDEDGNGLVPPLEHCIRTKWRGVTVDWNGTDPLL